MARSRVNRRVIAVIALVIIALLLSQLFKYGPISKSGKINKIVRVRMSSVCIMLWMHVHVVRGTEPLAGETSRDGEGGGTRTRRLVLVV